MSSGPGIQAALRLTCLYCRVLVCNQALRLSLHVDKCNVCVCDQHPRSLSSLRQRWSSCRTGWGWRGCRGSSQPCRCTSTGAAAGPVTEAASTPSTDSAQMRRYVETQDTGSQPVTTAEPQANSLQEKQAACRWTVAVQSWRILQMLEIGQDMRLRNFVQYFVGKCAIPQSGFTN